MSESDSVTSCLSVPRRTAEAVGRVERLAQTAAPWPFCRYSYESG